MRREEAREAAELGRGESVVRLAREFDPCFLRDLGDGFFLFFPICGDENGVSANCACVLPSKCDE